MPDRTDNGRISVRECILFVQNGQLRQRKTRLRLRPRSRREKKGGLIDSRQDREEEHSSAADKKQNASPGQIMLRAVQLLCDLSRPRDRPVNKVSQKCDYW